MNALGLALIGFGVILLYWIYIEPHTHPADTSGVLPGAPTTGYWTPPPGWQPGTGLPGPGYQPQGTTQ